jgi:peptide/nickel transport system substrate-binding protein
MCLNAGWVRDFPDPQTILDPLFNGASIQAENNQNWSQLDVPAINRAMIRARTLTDPAARARAWGRIDRQVTAQAAVALTSWFKAPLVRSRDVEAVPNRNTGFWDLTYTSLR